MKIYFEIFLHKNQHTKSHLKMPFYQNSFWYFFSFKNRLCQKKENTLFIAGLKVCFLQLVLIQFEILIELDIIRAFETFTEGQNKRVVYFINFNLETYRPPYLKKKKETWPVFKRNCEILLEFLLNWVFFITSLGFPWTVCHA